MTTQDQAVTGRRLFPSWASNFYPCLVEYEGTVYLTAEAAYQAAKTSDPVLKMRILAASSPQEAKRLGGTAKLVPDWDKKKLGVMLGVLRIKFSPGSTMARRLMAHDDPLVEWNRWHDNIWGICLCARCPGTGNNYLGKLLTGIKRELES